jgi:hypothetical protein
LFGDHASFLERKIIYVGNPQPLNTPPITVFVKVNKMPRLVKRNSKTISIIQAIRWVWKKLKGLK